MRTRFAPSPTGPLHLGHAFSAITAHDLARDMGGAFLLRIEDIDQTRARPHWETQIYEDLEWLGLSWEHPVMRQSDNMPAYDGALRQLWNLGVLYPCHCTRRDISAALSAPQEGAPVIGPDGAVYPGTCRRNPQGEYPQDGHLRLNMARALAHLDGRPLWFEEMDQGRQSIPPNHLLNNVGDVVVRRADFRTSYHLSVVVDDAVQAITHVVRGQDLFEATAIHVMLQACLDLPTPIYHHHRLIRDETGKRLAKRDDARAIANYRENGMSADNIHTIVTSPQTTEPKTA